MYGVENGLNLESFSGLRNLKPGLRNVSVCGVIVEFIDDPPQSATDVRNFRYHYRFADSSASVELAVPHGVLQDIVSKNFNIVTLTSGHNTDLAESILFSADYADGGETPPSNDPGFAFRESDGLTMNFVKGDLRNIGSEFEEDSDWDGWSEDDKEDSLKWLLQPGDVLRLSSAMTAWSHGHMVLVPNKDAIEKIGKFATGFKLEPDMSKRYVPED